MPANPSDDPLEPKETTRDRFMGGRVAVTQPRKGFRAGIDSVLLAAAVNANSQNVLELGSGAGAVACCLLAKLPDVKMVLVDKRKDMLFLAGQNLTENGFTAQAETLCLDVTAKGAVRSAAGLKADFFGSVIANPPYYDAASGTSPQDSSRAEARHLPEQQLDLWVKTAAASAAPKGEVIFIHLASALPELLDAFAKRFGALTILPIVPRAGQAASRVLVRGIKGSRAPLSLLSPLVLHQEEGHEYRPDIDSIFRGRARLDW